MKWVNSFIIIGYGITLFFWLSAEDNGWIVAALGAILGLLMTVRIATQWEQCRAAFWFYPLFGALAGALGMAGTLLLMLIKTSIHGHLYPDYPFLLMVAFATRLPAWIAAGALLGTAVALARQ